MSYFQKYQKFVNYMWLDKDELKLAYSYIERMMFESDENFEYYHNLQMFAHKCFNVLKKQKNCRIGLAVCKGDVVDFLLDSEHEFCSCSKVLFNTNVRKI